ncbi:MAG: glycosyl hydrolase, partial [Flavobacteriaceae bacterium]|nr:glycosyl hydrolase [Flavobacteriaceae bacterium]
SWGLNYPDLRGERLTSRQGRNRGGILVTPGKYSVTMAQRVDGKTTVLQGPQEFNVVAVYDGALPRKSYDEMNDFRKDIIALQQDLTATNTELSKALSRISAMMRAADKAENRSDELFEKLETARKSLLAIDKAMNGDDVKDEIGERSNPTPNDANRLGWVAFGNTYGPTGNHKGAYERAKKQLVGLKGKLANMLNTTIPAMEKELERIGAPWVEGQGLIKD